MKGKTTKYWFLSCLVCLSIVTAVTGPQMQVFAEDTASSKTKKEAAEGTHKVKLTFEGETIFEENVPANTVIVMLSAGNEKTESNVVTSDKEIVLQRPSVSEGKVFSKWDIKKTDGQIAVEPVIAEKNEWTITFKVEEGGTLKEEGSTVQSIKKQYVRGDALSEILPTPVTGTGYGFDGWYLNESKLTEELMNSYESKTKVEVVGKFFPDINGNDKDDRQEEITIKFVTNSSNKIKELQTVVGNVVNIPNLYEDEQVLTGWYTDSNFTAAFNAQEPLTSSMTLYAQWKDIETLINEDEPTPITDLAVSDQVERILDSRQQKLESEAAVAKEKSKSANDETATVYKETTYIINNKNQKGHFLYKFYDENEVFLFSLIMPYGKTIKTFQENELLRSEFSVRQNATVVLNSSQYIQPDSMLVSYDVRTVNINSVSITEITPSVSKVGHVKETDLDLQQEIEKGEEKKGMNIDPVNILIGAAVLVGGILLWLVQRLIRTKKKVKKKSNETDGTHEDANEE